MLLGIKANVRVHGGWVHISKQGGMSGYHTQNQLDKFTCGVSIQLNDAHNDAHIRQTDSSFGAAIRFLMHANT